MRTSESIVKLTPALVAVQEDMVAVKDSKNPHFKSGYASLDCILSTIKPALKENDLVIMQTTQLKEGGIIECITRVAHKSGEWVESECVVPIDKNTPQGFGSTLTYARRYGVALALGIGTMDDDDGNAAEDAVRKKQAKDHFRRIQKKASDRLKEIDQKMVLQAFKEAGLKLEQIDDESQVVDDLVALTKSEDQLMNIGKRAVELEKEAKQADQTSEEEKAEKAEPKKAPAKKAKTEEAEEAVEDPKENAKAEAEAKKAKAIENKKKADAKIAAAEAKKKAEAEAKEEEEEQEEEPAEAPSDEDPTAEDQYIEPQGPDADIKAVKPASHAPKADEIADSVYVDYIISFFQKMIERTLTSEMLAEYVDAVDTAWDKTALDKLFALYKQLNEGTVSIADAFPNYYEG